MYSIQQLKEIKKRFDAEFKNSEKIVTIIKPTGSDNLKKYFQFVIGSMTYVILQYSTNERLFDEFVAKHPYIKEYHLAIYKQDDLSASQDVLFVEHSLESYIKKYNLSFNI